MSIKKKIFPSLALTLAGIGGAQPLQAQETQPQALTAQNPDDYLVLLWAKTNLRLLQNGGLKLSWNESIKQIQTSNIPGPAAKDIEAEVIAKDLLDRAALPLILSRLQANPGGQLTETQVKNTFGKLATYLTLHTKNVATVAANLDKAEMTDAAQMFSLTDDLKQGGTLAGFNMRYGGGVRGMLDAVIDHYTGEEAGKVIDGMKIDITMSRGGSMLEANAKKGVIKIPGMYLRQQQVQQNVGYGFREFAAQIVIKQGPIGGQSYLTQPLPGAYNSPYVATQGHNFHIGTALDVLLVKAAERISALPPLPELKGEPAMAAPAKANQKTAPKKLKR